jgi:hypothetical protein
VEGVVVPHRESDLGGGHGLAIRSVFAHIQLDDDRLEAFSPLFIRDVEEFGVRRMRKQVADVHDADRWARRQCMKGGHALR